jgi:hypothetical protein
MPSDHRVGLDDHHRAKTAGPKAVEQNPEGSVQPAQADPGSLVALQNAQLMTKSDDLELQRRAASQACEDAME